MLSAIDEIAAVTLAVQPDGNTCVTATVDGKSVDPKSPLGIELIRYVGGALDRERFGDAFHFDLSDGAPPPPKACPACGSRDLDIEAYDGVVAECHGTIVSEPDTYVAVCECGWREDD